MKWMKITIHWSQEDKKLQRINKSNNETNNYI